MEQERQQDENEEQEMEQDWNRKTWGQNNRVQTNKGVAFIGLVMTDKMDMEQNSDGSHDTD